jgi:16S rRNA (uracil1498-N3)-methyltransferase
LSDPGSYLAASRAAAAHVFVDDLEVPVLGADDAHHLARVLRLQPGETVSVADGRGGWRLCAFTGGRAAPTDGRGVPADGRGAAGAGRGPAAGLEPVGPVGHPPILTPSITVGFALTKGDRPEWAVQKLTEIGVDRIIPLHTARSVVRWDGDRAGRHLERLREVARQAAMQSRRLLLPVLDEVSVPTQVLAGASALAASAAPGVGTAPTGATALGVETALGVAAVEGVATAQGGAAPAVGIPALAVPGGAPLSLRHPTVLVGPEGGWSSEEEDAAPATVDLGPTVLRTETAAVVAAAILAALRGGFTTLHDR